MSLTAEFIKLRHFTVESKTPIKAHVTLWHSSDSSQQHETDARPKAKTPAKARVCQQAID
jgi:hypothetical protein